VTIVVTEIQLKEVPGVILIGVPNGISANGSDDDDDDNDNDNKFNRYV